MAVGVGRVGVVSCPANPSTPASPPLPTASSPPSTIHNSTGNASANVNVNANVHGNGGGGGGGVGGRGVAASAAPVVHVLQRGRNQQKPNVNQPVVNIPVILGAKQLSSRGVVSPPLGPESPTHSRYPHAPPITILSSPTSASHSQGSSVGTTVTCGSEVSPTANVSSSFITGLLHCWNQCNTSDIEWIKVIGEQTMLFSESPKIPGLSDKEAKVIGVFGRQDVGKTALMQHLLGVNDATPAPTLGASIALSPEQLLLVDTQGAFSPDQLTKLMKEQPQLPPNVLSYENLVELQSIQLAVWLISVCHIVIVVQDALTDLNLWRLLRTAEMVKAYIPDPSLLTSTTTEASGLDEYTSDLVFVYNNAYYDDLSIDRDNIVPELKRAVGMYFSQTRFLSSRRNASPQPSGTTASSTSQQGYPSTAEKSFPVFVVPAQDCFCSTSSSLAMSNVVHSLLEMPVSPFARPISQRDWLRNAARLWDMIKKSTVINEYLKTLQRVQMMSTT
ncbi:protein SMG9 [Pelomyxa schiedti]|nr:protein SMG9 [Pelomyxa schiedti]